MIPATYIYHAHSDHWGETFAAPTDGETSTHSDDAPPTPPRLLDAMGRLLELLSGRAMRPASRTVNCPSHWAQARRPLSL